MNKKSIRKSSSSTSTNSDSLSTTTTKSNISTGSSKSTKSSKSAKSASSQASVDSVGIGASAGSPKPGTAVNQQQAIVDGHLRFRLMPEGSGNNLMNIYDHHVFDCVVFVIFCERHRSIALTNVSERHRMFSWFPFVLLHDVFTWSKISRDGLAIILGKIGDSEMDPTMATLPDYTMSWLNILRIQVPGPGLGSGSGSSGPSPRSSSPGPSGKPTRRYHTRITQFVKFNGSTKEFKCCQNTSRIRWVRMNDILPKESIPSKSSMNRDRETRSNSSKIVEAGAAGAAARDQLWGEEVTIMAQSLCTEERTFLSEYTLESCCPYPPGSDELSLLTQVGFSLERIYELYEDYVHHLYPAFWMTLNSFRCFMLKYGMFSKVESDSERTRRLFQVVSVTSPDGGGGQTGKSSSVKYLTFNQLLLTIASMDPAADSGQLERSKFLFKYYDLDNRNQLSMAQIGEMIRDTGPTLSAKQLEDRTDDALKAFGLISNTLSYEVFATAMAEQRIPLIDRLLRTEKSYFEAKKQSALVNKSADYLTSLGLGPAKQTAGADAASSSPNQNSQKKQSGGGTKSDTSSSSSSSVGPLCRHHQPKKYEYGLHAVTLDSAGRCVDPRIICDNWISQWSEKEMSHHRFSIENVFRVNSIGNIFIDLVRDFRNKQLNNNPASGASTSVSANPESRATFATTRVPAPVPASTAPESSSVPSDCRGLLSAEEDWDTLALYLEILCEQSIAILRNEPKIIRLSSPVFIFGDLQGSLQDLFVYESQLFHSTPVLATNLLFLGNYSGISFGFGVECVIYLLALKVSMPNKIYLLRGRNELRLFNQRHFAEECRHKYGDKYGAKIYEMLNRVFDTMPIGATVDETVFCTHSGIPRNCSAKRLVTHFRNNYGTATFAELRNPEQILPIAYELIANLPMTYAPDEIIDASRKSTTGFVVTRTGNAYYYNRAAFDAFMTANQFDFHIRSHNPCEDGYAMCYGNRCLTIYSASKCLNSMLSNTCIIMINDSKRNIRFVRLSTSKIGAAGARGGGAGAAAGGGGAAAAGGRDRSGTQSKRSKTEKK